MIYNLETGRQANAAFFIRLWPSIPTLQDRKTWLEPSSQKNPKVSVSHLETPPRHTQPQPISCSGDRTWWLRSMWSRQQVDNSVLPVQRVQRAACYVWQDSVRAKPRHVLRNTSNRSHQKRFSILKWGHTSTQCVQSAPEVLVYQLLIVESPWNAWGIACYISETSR